MIQQFRGKLRGTKLLTDDQNRLEATAGRTFVYRINQPHVPAAAFREPTCYIFHLVAEAFGRNQGWTFGRVRDGKRKGRKKKTEERVGSVRN